MFENIAAIDIGSSSIKVVAAKTGFRDFQLKSLSYEEIDLSIEHSATALVSTITKIMHEEDLSGFTIITNLPMEKEIIRNITFPFSDVEKIAEAIPFEAEENIPFKLDDIILDFLPLKSGKEGEGRVLLAAVHKETVYDFLTHLNECGVKPVRLGMESIALFECYKYFNRIGDENIIQLDIGNNKTIINIIQNNQLLFTRSIAIGIGLIYNAVSEYLKLSLAETVRLFHTLNIDLTTFENNVQREHYKSLGITRPRLKKIFEISTEVIHELNEQISLTIKALSLEYGNLSYNRIMISGGGSNITGIGTLLSREFEIPVVSLPFLDNYSEQTIRTQFPIAFGIVLSYISKKKAYINFLKGEFIPDIAGASRKIYYLAGTFAISTIIVLLLNFIISFILSSISNRDYNRIVQEEFRRSFNISKASDDPISDAQKMIKNEKKKLDSINQLLPEDSTVLDTVRDVIVCFPKSNDFELKNLLVQQHVIRIEGAISSTKQLDEFKNNLLKTKRFDQPSVSVTGSQRDMTRFTMVIKQKAK